MRTLERAFAIIRCFSPEQPSLTLQQIADRIGLAKSTAFRLVGALEQAGYLVRLPDLRYSLSLEFVRLAGIANRSLDVARLLRPVLEELAAATGENVTLNSVSGNERVCIDVARSKSPLIGVNKPGERVPLGLGAASMVLMAYLPERELQAVLPSAAKVAKCSAKELVSILATTRSQGYAVSHGGGVGGLTGLSTPIFASDGSVRYAVTVVVPTARAKGRVASLLVQARQASIAASHKLGGGCGRFGPIAAGAPREAATVH